MQERIFPVVLYDSEVTFLVERKDAIISLLYFVCTTSHNIRNMTSNLLVFQTSEGISYRPVAFLILIVFRNMSSLSSVKCPSLTST